MTKENSEQKYRMIAKTYEGLEEVLAVELHEIGASDIKLLRRAVEFYGDLAMMYKANYWLRSAVSILKPIATFEVKDEQELYDQIYGIKWMNYFDLGKTFAIQTTVNNHETIQHSRYAAYRVKDAIADQFRYYFNQRPDVDPLNANININVYISGTHCEVALNSSGMPLFKRGYKIEMHRAPLNEVLAAGMILLSGWDKNSNFIDPMCGSGTLLIEAALMAYNFPPQFMRRNFSFQNWADYDPSLWRELTSDLVKNQREFEHQIIGGDISSKNLEIANQIITNMKFHKDIELVQKDVRDHKAPEGETKGWIVTNPPYGERLHSKDLIALYEKIGTAFKHNFPGYIAALISSDVEAVKVIGLKPSKKRELYNGGLLCKFNTYDLYEGSKKVKKVEEGVSEVVEVKDAEEVEPVNKGEDILTNLFNEGTLVEEKPLLKEERQEDRSGNYSKPREDKPRRRDDDKGSYGKRRDDGERKPRRDYGERKPRRDDDRGSYGKRRDGDDHNESRGKSYGDSKRSFGGNQKKEFKRELGKDYYNSNGKDPEKQANKRDKDAPPKRYAPNPRPKDKDDDWKAKRENKSGFKKGDKPKRFTPNPRPKDDDKKSGAKRDDNSKYKRSSDDKPGARSFKRSDDKDKKWSPKEGSGGDRSRGGARKGGSKKGR